MKLLLQLADGLVEKGHSHADSIKSWVAAVDKHHKDFTLRMEKYREKLESTLGIPLDRSVVSLIEFQDVLARTPTGWWDLVKRYATQTYPPMGFY